MSFQHTIQRVMSGEARGPLPAAGRLALSAVEPFYKFGVSLRNRRFDRNPARIRHLPKPVISVGNLTTGGTGKTPVVRFLAEQLRRRGKGVAILSRGYKSAPGTLGDEQRMLQSLLNEPADGDVVPPAAPLVIEADPDRYAAGLRALEREPRIDLFLLDDGFQHRRLHRNLDIVLLHAAEPFGYGHVLPRGLLREPTAGLSRAGAVVVTNADAVADATIETLKQDVVRLGLTCPVFVEQHMPTGFRAADGAAHPLSALKSRWVACFSGLASPQAFERQMRELAGDLVHIDRLPDHHNYTPKDVLLLQLTARSAGADVLVTTEKDWIKLAELPGTSQADSLVSRLDTAQLDRPIWRLDVEARFRGDDGIRLVDLVLQTVAADQTS